LERSRLYQTWRDFAGMTTLVGAPIIVLVGILGGVATPDEIGGVVALMGFGIAFTQPMRPRFKDIFTALQRGEKVASDLVFVIAAALAIAFVIKWANWNATIAAFSLVTVVPGLLLPALASFFLGIPMGLMLSGVMFLPLIAAVFEPGRATGSPLGTPFAALVLTYAVFIGAMLRACLFPPAILRLALTSRISIACVWTTPLLLEQIPVEFTHNPRA